MFSRFCRLTFDAASDCPASAIGQRQLKSAQRVHLLGPILSLFVANLHISRIIKYAPNLTNCSTATPIEKPLLSENTIVPLRGEGGYPPKSARFFVFAKVGGGIPLVVEKRRWGFPILPLHTLQVKLTAGTGHIIIASFGLFCCGIRVPSEN